MCVCVCERERERERVQRIGTEKRVKSKFCYVIFMFQFNFTIKSFFTIRIRDCFNCNAKFLIKILLGNYHLELEHRAGSEPRLELEARA